MPSELPADEPNLQPVEVADLRTDGDVHPGGTHTQHVERLFREHNASLIRYLRVRLPPEEAKEVAQEAYVKMLGLHDPDRVNFLVAYLYRTASNLAKNRIKQHVQRRRDDELIFFQTEDERSPERLCADRAEVALVRQALSELPANCREAFHLVRVEGLSSDEAGRRMKMHPRRVRRYVARALAHCLAVTAAADAVKAEVHGGLP